MLALIPVGVISIILAPYFFDKVNVLPSVFQPILMSVLFVTIYVALLTLRGRVGMFITLTAITALFISILLVKLGDAHSGDVTIGGLLPWSDASRYYQGAKMLAEGIDATIWNGRRPFFTAMLAVLLALTGQNLQITLVLLVLITAVSVFFLTQEAANRYGAVTGAVTLFVIALFYYRSVGTVMSEHLGLALGAFALTLLLNGAFKRQMITLWAGLFLLGLALVARAGAFLVLPVLLIGATFLLWDTKRDRFAFMIGGTISVVSPFLVDSILRKIVAPQALPFGNFSYTLYGLFVGNQGWQKVLTDHPEIASISGDTEKSRAIFQLALEALRSDPSLAIKGMLLTWLEFLESRIGAFSFVTRVPQFSRFPTLILFILGAIGIYVVVRYRHRPPNTILLLLVAGILLSIPFVSPQDADKMRVYAATMPVNAIIVGLGATMILGKIRWKGFKFANENTNNIVPIKAPMAAGFLLVGICFLGAIMLGLRSDSWSKVVQSDEANCSQGSELLYSRFSPGSSFNLVAAETRGSPFDLNTSEDKFKKGLAGLGIYPELADGLNGWQDGQSLTFGLKYPRIVDDNKFGRLWLVVDSEQLAHLSPGIVRICASPTTNAWVSRYNFYYVDTIEAVKP